MIEQKIDKYVLHESRTGLMFLDEHNQILATDDLAVLRRTEVFLEHKLGIPLDIRSVKFFKYEKREVEE